MNLMRIWALAHNVFRETIRDRVLYLVILFAVVMLIGTSMLPPLANGGETKILIDLGLATINVIGLIVAVFIGTGLVHKEIEKRTVYLLIAKPVRRSEFIVGKHIGLALLLSVLLILMATIDAAMLTVQQIPFPLLPVGCALLFIWLELLVMVAGSLLFGVFTSPILATLYTLALYGVGHFSRALLELGNLTQNTVLGTVGKIVYLIVPDLERLNLKNEAVYGILPPWPELTGHALYGILYIVLLLSMAVLVFSRRQF